MHVWGKHAYFLFAHCPFQVLLPVYLHQTKQLKPLKHQCFANKVLYYVLNNNNGGNLYL